MGNARGERQTLVISSTVPVAEHELEDPGAGARPAGGPRSGRQAAPVAHPAADAQVPGTTHDYGFAMAQHTGDTHALVQAKSRHVLQCRITVADGQLVPTRVRHRQVATRPDGMFADDAAGHIHVGGEGVDIWRPTLSPDAAPKPSSSMPSLRPAFRAMMSRGRRCGMSARTAGWSPRRRAWTVPRSTGRGARASPTAWRQSKSPQTPSTG